MKSSKPVVPNPRRTAGKSTGRKIKHFDQSDVFSLGGIELARPGIFLRAVPGRYLHGRLAFIAQCDEPCLQPSMIGLATSYADATAV